MIEASHREASAPGDVPAEDSVGLAGKGIYLLLAVVIVAIDQVTKGLVEGGIGLHERHEIIPGLLNFTHVRNSGVAFGLFADQGTAQVGAWILSGLGAAALVIVGLYFWRTATADRILLSALGLILGGAVGNLIDRVGSGSVTDFIDVYVGTYHWHTFNVADSAITVGICLMLLDLFRSGRSSDAVDGGGTGDAGPE